MSDKYCNICGEKSEAIEENLELPHERDCHIEELEHKLELAKEVLKKIQWAEKLGLLINGEKIATQVLEQLK